MRPSDPVPGGKYRLTRAQLAVLRALGSRNAVRSATSLSYSPEVCALGQDICSADSRARDWGMPEDVRVALAGLERLGLVRRVHSSEHRHSYTLTDEGIVDLQTRGTDG